MSIKQKIYEDYIKRDRLPQYKNLLQIAKDNGYLMLGVADFYDMIQNLGNIQKGTKIILNRHDIDTSPRVAAEMFLIEKEVYGKNGSATYYFRNSTIDNELISAIDEYGYEAGYHYEEISDYEKKHKLKNIECIKEKLPEIRQQFLYDLENFRKSTGSNSVTVASHGDFINTKLLLQNYAILEDQATREKAGIKVEAYDRSIMDCVYARFADHLLLGNFLNEVIDSIEQRCEIIMILSHPRNWKVDIAANTKENIKRFYQGILYRM